MNILSIKIYRKIDVKAAKVLLNALDLFDHHSEDDQIDLNVAVPSE